jgi:hypothetical protein
VRWLHAVGVSDQVLHIAIDVRFAEEQIRGHVCDGVRRSKPFSGWLGLIGALDAMISWPRQERTVSSVDKRAPVSSVEQDGER